MLVLGLDIGTTTVSAVVMQGGEVLAAKTLKNDAFLPGRPVWERAQDVETIVAAAMQAVTELRTAYPQIERIGLTGQQHGIVYLDRAGAPLSPLYTWQDGRGDLPYDGQQSYAARLTELTGYPLATGYGLVTHFYNLKNGLVPENAAVFCTIHDYIAMRLSGRTAPKIDPSDAASFGCFDLVHGCFDTAALQKAGIDPAILPELAETPCLGGEPPVYVAIGDNQASFLGATGGQTGCMLVNVGTGSQFSVHVPRYMTCPGLETRPFPSGGYLLVGSSLCGGRAYALLERFFRETAAMLGLSTASCYEAMGRLLEEAPAPADPVRVVPLFQGTRAEPGLRGSIENISVDNFTPLSLLYGMLQGMTDELHEMYRHYADQGGSSGALYGSGNGLRKNAHLRRCFERTFAQPLTLSRNEEEAACGAALFAAAN